MKAPRDEMYGKSTQGT